MTNADKSIERRKSPRHQVADSAFVLLGAQSRTLAQIIEISPSGLSGGLSFLHVSGDDPLVGPSEATIILADHSFYFDKIPCEIISDSPIPTELNFGSRAMMRGSIAFGELTSDNKSQLEYFLRNYTTSEVTSLTEKQGD
ncbi:MAG: PilZ domain-containing protein [Deltaproteobacteria bacterium]|nr:PilZ domain-containing protein [Deltaproteobacteria bacterium]